MPFRKVFACRLIAVAAASAFVIACAHDGSAQVGDKRQITGEGYGFSHDSYDDDGLRTATVRGESGILGDGFVDVTGLDLTTYKHDPDERVDLVIKVPSCRYEVTARKLTSDERVSAVSGDGRLKLEGLGIDWSDSDSALVIRDDVRAVIVDAGRDEERRVEIFSDRLLYKFETGLIRFTDNVRVVDQSEFAMHADRIEATMREGADEPDRIVARGNVVIDARLKDRAVSMVGDSALYEVDVDGRKIARMPDGAKWASGFSGGRSDVLEMDLEKQSFAGTGMVVISLREAEDDLPIDVMASSYTMSGDEVTFSGDVTAERGSESHMHCDEMAITLDDAGKPEAVSAWGDVSMSMVRDDRRTDASGEVMRYEGIDTPDARVEITGDPSWRSGGDSGSGEVIELFPETRKFVARGDAKARIAARRGSFSPDAGAPVGFGNEAVDVTADRYEIDEKGAVFHDSVEVVHSRWNLRSGSLGFAFSSDGEHLEQVVAEDAVRFESVPVDGKMGGVDGGAPEDAFGNKPWTLDCQRLTIDIDPSTEDVAGMVADGGITLRQGTRSARGERLAYDPSTEEFMLSGGPVIDDPEGMSFRGNEKTIIHASRTSRTVTADGWYRVLVPVDPDGSDIRVPGVPGGRPEGKN